MTDFCDFVPDDPSCQTTPEPEPEPVDPSPGPDDGGKGDDGGKPDDGDKPDDGPDDMPDDGGKMMHDDKEKGMTWEEFDEKAGEYFDPMGGNLAYLGVAVGAVADIALRTFVWHEKNADTNSQNAAGTGNTDYYKLLHQVEAYGGLGVWGIAALTQLFATMGIMVGINMMVWSTIVPLGGGLLELGVAVLSFMAYDQFFKQSELATPNAYSAAYMAKMEREMAEHTASHVAGAFEIYHAMGDWLWAAYMAADDEEKAKWREDKDFLMMLHLTPEEVEKYGMNDDKKMEMDGDKDMSKLMVGPPSLRKLMRF